MARAMSGWRIGSLAGLDIRIHWSWLIIFALLTWALATQILPLADLVGRENTWFTGIERQEEFLKNYQTAHPDADSNQVRAATRKWMAQNTEWPPWQYWTFGAIGAIGLFLCVLAHEMSHSLVARGKGIPVEGITLFIFGGVSSLKDEANSPGDEFQVAAAGPFMSLLIGGFCWAIWALVPLPEQLTALVFYFAFINVLLAAFNLVPGFPLDGGRILRAGLWKMTGSLNQATQMAAAVGSGIGLVMIVGGLGFGLLTWNFSFLWIALIGWFLRSSAQAGARQTAIRQALSGLEVSDSLTKDVVTVSPDITIENLVDDYFYEYRYRSYPVVENDQILGMISVKDVQGVPRNKWGETTVRDAMHQVAEENLVHPDDRLLDAFRKMMSEDKGHLPVIEGGELRGMITRHDVMDLLQLRTDLGDVAELPGGGRS